MCTSATFRSNFCLYITALPGLPVPEMFEGITAKVTLQELFKIYCRKNKI